MERAKQVDGTYGATDGEVAYSCRELINKFLAHPTTLRHERTQTWEIEKIYPDIRAILDDFEKRFVEKTEGIVVLMSESSNSTTAFRKLSNAIDEGK